MLYKLPAHFVYIFCLVRPAAPPYRPLSLAGSVFSALRTFVDIELDKVLKTERKRAASSSREQQRDKEKEREGERSKQITAGLAGKFQAKLNC